MAAAGVLEAAPGPARTARPLRVWADVTHPADVQFFAPVIQELTRAGHAVRVTTRARGETIALLQKKGIPHTSILADHDNFALKVGAMAARTAALAFVPRFDVALSLENAMPVAVARMRGKPSVLFLDNDHKFHIRSKVQDLENWIKLKSTRVVVPATFDAGVLGGRPHDVYEGMKEDVYLSGFMPDPGVLAQVPFKRYVVVRPEALGSVYVTQKRSITPQVLKALSDAGVDVVFLPRAASDRKDAEGTSAFVPGQPLDGPSLCYYASAVLTGSGTIAREAAALGRPALSFFPDALLSVDRHLVEAGRMTHSRDVAEIAAWTRRQYERDSPPSVGRSDALRRVVGFIEAAAP